MAVATGIYVVKDALITLATVEYENQVTSAVLKAEQNVQTLRTLAPDGALTDTDSPVWTLELTIVQKNNTGGLAHALRTAAAAPDSPLAVVLAPKNLDGEDQAAFSIKPVWPDFGGAQGAYPTAELVLAVIGQPVFTPIDES